MSHKENDSEDDWQEVGEGSEIPPTPVLVEGTGGTIANQQQLLPVLPPPPSNNSNPRYV